MSLPRQKHSYADNKKPLRRQSLCMLGMCMRQDTAVIQKDSGRIWGGMLLIRSLAGAFCAGRHVQEGLSKALRQHPGIIAPKKCIARGSHHICNVAAADLPVAARTLHMASTSGGHGKAKSSHLATCSRVATWKTRRKYESHAWQPAISTDLPNHPAGA